MMTAGPWRLDALEILRVTRTAKFDRAHLLETVGAIVASGQVEVDVVNERREDGPDREAVDAPAVTRAKLRQLLGALDELNPLTFREGPHTILQRYVERTGAVLDLIAADTLESKRTVANIASFMRFAADWQGENPRGTLAGFVAYLDAYQGAGGELPTSVELSEDVDGVRLMTLDQAKGLEFPIVFVPNSARRGVARARGRRRPLPARAPARGRARRRHPHGRGAAAAVRPGPRSTGGGVDAVIPLVLPSFLP